MGVKWSPNERYMILLGVELGYFDNLGVRSLTLEQKEYAINKDQEIGVRATTRLLQLPRDYTEMVKS